MIIDWFKFGPALFLLLLPIGLFHGKKIRFRPIAFDWEGQWPQILTLGLHWIDLGRAILGGWLLHQALSLGPGAAGLARFGVPLTTAAVLIVAVAIQTMVCREEESANAPFAFVVGLLFGVYPPVTAGFAILLAFSAAAGARTPSAAFPLLTVTLAVLGILFGGKKTSLLVAGGACAVLLPWLLSIMFSRELVLTYRAKRFDKNSPVSPPPR